MSGASSARMPARFFVDSVEPDGEPRTGGVVHLSAEDSHHASRVLRLRSGDAVELVWAGAPGRVWQARLEELGHGALARFERVLEEPLSPVLRILLVQGLPSLPKVDDIIDKGTQVGVDEFVLIAAHESPPGAESKAEKRLERWRRIAREAAKQSRQPAVPRVRLERVDDALVKRLSQEGWRSLVLDPAADLRLIEASPHSGSFGMGPAPNESGLAVWVGPESGWSDAELSMFAAAGAGTARLGRRILRTETAGAVAAAVVRSMVGDW